MQDWWGNMCAGGVHASGNDLSEGRIALACTMISEMSRYVCVTV